MACPSASRRCPHHAVTILVLAGALLNLGTAQIPAQERGARWIDQLNSAARRLDTAVSQNVRPESRLRRQADRLFERVDEIASARRAPSERQLRAIHDAAIVLMSELLDSAAQTHPERLGRLEQMLGHTQAVAGHAAAALHAESASLDEVKKRIAMSASDTAEALNQAAQELNEGLDDKGDPDLQRIAERSSSLRDQVQSLQVESADNAAEPAIVAANLAATIRGDLLVYAFSDPGVRLNDLQVSRRAALHLQEELFDFALIAAHREGANSPTPMTRLGRFVNVLLQDLTALRDAAPENDRDLMQNMVADARRVRLDIRNLTQDARYAPRQRLDDIYGRITRVIEQTESYQPQANERTVGLLHVVQADLVALRELALIAATEQMGLHDSSVNHLLPQLTNIDLSAEEQLGVKLSVQDGRVTLASVAVRGPAARAGLKEGDVLVSTQGRQIETDVDLASELEAAAREQRELHLNLERNGKPLTRRISLVTAARHANRSSGDDANQ